MIETLIPEPEPYVIDDSQFLIVLCHRYGPMEKEWTSVGCNPDGTLCVWRSFMPFDNNDLPKNWTMAYAQT